MADKLDNRWTRAETLYLIDLLKRHPVLYAAKPGGRLNSACMIDERRKAIEAVRSEMAVMKEGVTDAVIRTKIRTLRNQVTMEKRRQKYGVSSDVSPKWWCYKNLKFLADATVTDPGGTDEIILSSEDSNDFVPCSCARSGCAENYNEEGSTCGRKVNRKSSDLETMAQKAEQSLKNIKKMEDNISALAQRAKESLKSLEMLDSSSDFRDEVRNDVDMKEILDGLVSRNISLKPSAANKTISGIIVNQAQQQLNRDDGLFTEDLTDSQSDSQQSGSQQRMRNILTLQERVRAIEEYDRKPMYTKVASMFNCSWEQIKNIVQNRKAILDFYEATKKDGPTSSPDQEIMRQHKIAFLGECLYEYIQRAQCHAGATLNEDMIRMKANEMRELMQIEGFLPNKAWLNQFKSTYNISLSQGRILLTRTPPASLDIKDIMMYCNRNKPVESQPPPLVMRSDYTATANTLAVVDSANSATAEELKQRRQRKITFLGKALYEYIQRAQFHHHMPLDEELLRPIAVELATMLKIDNFQPTKSWIQHFKTEYNFHTSQYSHLFRHTRTPPFSLDLKDIISYCSRMDQKNAKVNLVERDNQMVKQTEAEMRTVIEKEEPQLQPQPEQPPEKQEIIVLPSNVARPQITTPALCREVEDEVEDIKPDITEIKIEPQEAPVADDGPPLKIPKMESPQEQPIHSPGHWSEHSSEDEEPLPRHAKNYADALRLLKPLEEFAMLEENYRAIGLITQLESIFSNPPNGCS